jgi:glycosyltransferase involved in cell wall biosynthesis
MDASPTQVLYASSYADVVGGGQVSLLLLIKNLDRAEFTPAILCPYEGEVADQARSLGARPYFAFRHGLQDSPRLVRAARYTHALRTTAKRVGAAIVHADGLYAALLAGLSTVGSGVEVIFQAGTSESGRVWDRVAPPLCTKIICVSQSTAERFRQSPKVRVVFNGVDLAEFQPRVTDYRAKLAVDSTTFVIGYAGQMIVGKGVDVLLRAFGRFHAQVPNSTLLLAGRGTDEAFLRNRAGGGVRFIPFSPSMAPFYSALDVFALPTLYKEGLSRSLIEAMACGVPCVTTPLGGNIETVVEGETGFFVPSGNESMLVQRLHDLYQNPERRRAMGRAGRGRAEAVFDIGQCTRRIEEIYRQTVR